MTGTVLYFTSLMVHIVQKKSPDHDLVLQLQEFYQLLSIKRGRSSFKSSRILNKFLLFLKVPLLTSMFMSLDWSSRNCFTFTTSQPKYLRLVSSWVVSQTCDLRPLVLNLQTSKQTSALWRSVCLWLRVLWLLVQTLPRGQEGVKPTSLSGLWLRTFTWSRTRN